MNINFSSKLRLIKKHLKKSRNISLLDIGCGPGDFINFLPNSFKKTGIDLNPNITKNKNIIHDDFNKHDFKSTRFDCITLWQVFEHLPNPQYSLKKIYQLLRPNGLLLLDTPNCQSLGFKYGQKHFFHLDSPRHLFIPNPTSLKLILSQIGFKDIDIKNPFYDYPQDLFYSLRHSNMKYLIYPLYPFFKIISPQLLLVKASK